MNCPFCGNEMGRGKLRSKGGMYFLPDGEKSPRLYSEKEMEKHNAIPFLTFKYTGAPEYPQAYVCRACNKLIMDINLNDIKGVSGVER